MRRRGAILDKGPAGLATAVLRRLYQGPAGANQRNAALWAVDGVTAAHVGLHPGRHRPEDWDDDSSRLRLRAGAQDCAQHAEQAEIDWMARPRLVSPCARETH
jgi:hypothetical protein